MTTNAIFHKLGSYNYLIMFDITDQFEKFMLGVSTLIPKAKLLPSTRQCLIVDNR